MIVRLSEVKGAQAHAHAYADYLKSQVLTTLRKVGGYIGAKLLERETSDGVEIVVITLWRSLDSIRKFAGRDLEKAVVNDDVVSLFLQYDHRVRYYKVVVMDDPQHG